jgi:hypothetical protein
MRIVLSIPRARVEMWDRSDQHVRRVIVASASVAVGHAAMDATIANYPDWRFTLRNGILVIRQHPRGCLGPPLPAAVVHRGQQLVLHCEERAKRKAAASRGFERRSVISLKGDAKGSKIVLRHRIAASTSASHRSDRFWGPGSSSGPLEKCRRGGAI